MSKSARTSGSALSEASRTSGSALSAGLELGRVFCEERAQLSLRDESVFIGVRLIEKIEKSFIRYFVAGQFAVFVLVEAHHASD